MRLKPGFDPLLQAYGGMMSVTGRPEDPPTFCDRHVVHHRRARRTPPARPHRQGLLVKHN
jgi:crotonobetainyl-CoA:carnitine CoA-transferase CaiB-like acyl-CoA transferase